MRKLSVFNHVSLDGYFTDRNGDMSWAHAGSDDPEFSAFMKGNASGGGVLLFGRVTYELMLRYWPTPAAKKNDPEVAEAMNTLEKIVFSRSLKRVDWNKTRLVQGDLIPEVRELKKGSGKDLVVLGSGSIVAQLAAQGLIDAYQVLVNPVVLGKGRTMFEGVQHPLALKLTQTRTFKNGKVFLCYETASGT
jgi:dihydrofolate reductase